MDQSDLPLFQRWPALAGRIPHLSLCTLPTPVLPAPALADALHLDALHIKRDDLSAADYGGNKTRKLEFLLGDARQRGRKRVLAFGYAGSNFAAATAWYARQQGLGSISMLLPQPNAAYVRENLLLSLAAGAELHSAPNEFGLALKAIGTSLKHGLHAQWPYWIPAGGSSPLGVLGFVNAGLELAQQIQRGDCPQPQAIYLALGSMGSVAGLAIGLRACGLPIPIQAVRVVPTRYGNRKGLSRLVHRTCQYLRRQGAETPEPEQALTLCQLRDEFFGQAYGEFTDAAREAMQLGQSQAGIELDGTYSGKAMAALIADARQGVIKDQAILFWNTHNSQDTQPLIADQDPQRLPVSLRRYFEQPPQD